MGAMQRIVRNCLRLTLIALLVVAEPLCAKPKIRVQLYGESIELKGGINWVHVYLILPNGDHAEGLCGQTIGQPSCILEPFAAEKRRKSPCQLQNDSKATCYESEVYEADRKKNDIVLYGGAGKVTYHIVGAW